MLSEKQALSKGQLLFSPLTHLGQRKFVIVIATAHQFRQRVVETLEPRYEVQGFADGIQAFAWFKEHVARVPDLVLLEVDLPKIDGYEVARRLRATFVQTVIIICPSSDEKRRLPPDVGVDDFLTVPFQPYVLAALVHYHLERGTREGMQ